MMSGHHESLAIADGIHHQANGFEGTLEPLNFNLTIALVQDTLEAITLILEGKDKRILHLVILFDPLLREEVDGKSCGSTVVCSRRLHGLSCGISGSVYGKVFDEIVG